MRIVDDLIRGIEDAEEVDRVARPVADLTKRALSSPPVSDALRGRWLGHPAHPMLTDVPIGAWTSAFFLDLLGGQSTERAADVLVGLGALTALPTAAAGLADWSGTEGPERRIGLVHAVSNLTATTLYALSYRSRRRGDRGRGLTLSYAGAAVATVGGHLGGHLAYRHGVNVAAGGHCRPSPTP